MVKQYQILKLVKHVWLIYREAIMLEKINEKMIQKYTNLLSEVKKTKVNYYYKIAKKNLGYKYILTYQIFPLNIY